MNPAFETAQWLLSKNELPAARELARALLRACPPDETDALNRIAGILFQARAYSAATPPALEVLRRLPDTLGPIQNAAHCLDKINSPDEAVMLLKHALRIAPHSADVRLDLSLALTNAGQPEEGRRILEILERELDPAVDEESARSRIARMAAFNIGWHELRAGKLRSGLERLRTGRKLGCWGCADPELGVPRFGPGIELEGKSIVILGEGGQGDELMLCRFAAYLSDRGARVSWITGHPGLHSILKRVRGIREVLTLKEAQAAKAFDYWSPSMDLPLDLDLGTEQLWPSTTKGYLLSHAFYDGRWSTELQRSSNLRVGLRWKGNAYFETDSQRSIPFRWLIDRFPKAGVSYYSLQRDEGFEEIQSHDPVVNWGPRLESWEDTLGAIHHMDLVITTCTSVAHASAGLGKPTWLLCPAISYYPWALPGELTPWYPSVRLFRQPRSDRWDIPLDRVAFELERATRRD